MKTLSLGACRCPELSPLPESGETPEDSDTEMAGSEATADEGGEEADDADNFVVQHRARAADASSEAESSSGDELHFDADTDSLVDAAPSVLPTIALEHHTEGFAD